MGQKSLPRLEKLGTTMYNEVSVYNLYERWMSVKFGVLIRFIISMIFFFRFPMFDFNWEDCKHSVLGFVKSTYKKYRRIILEKIVRLRDDYFPNYSNMRTYMYQCLNKYKAITLYAIRARKMRFFRKYKGTYYKGLFLKGV